MGNTNNSKLAVFWTVVGGIAVALITAFGAYYSGSAAKEREISATQTAEIRIMTLTPSLTNTSNIIEATRIITVEVTRLVEVTRIAEVTQVINPLPITTSNPSNYKLDITRNSNTTGFSVTIKSVELLQNGNMRWYFDFKNDSSADVNIGFNYPETYTVDENGFQYKVIDADSGQIDSRGWGYIVKRGVKVSHWFEFPGPKDGAERFTMYIASGCILCPSYPSFTFTLPEQ